MRRKETDWPPQVQCQWSTMDLNRLSKISGNFANYHHFIVLFTVDNTVVLVVVIAIIILIVIAVVVVTTITVNFSDNKTPNALPLMSSKLLVGVQLPDLNEDHTSYFSCQFFPIIVDFNGFQ